MEYIKLANVLRKNMIKYGFLWIFDDFWANPLSDILPCILFRAVAQPSVVPWRGRTQVVRRRPTLHLRCRHVPLHAASGLGWRVGILRVPLQGEPWDTKTTTQSTSCTSAVWRFHRHILGFYMVLPNGYEWRFCQAPALQGSRTHVGSHFELCWNEPLFVTYGPATLQVDGDCPTCHWNVFFFMVLFPWSFQWFFPAYPHISRVGWYHEGPMLSLEVWTALCLSIPVFGRRPRRGTADVFFWAVNHPTKKMGFSHLVIIPIVILASTAEWQTNVGWWGAILIILHPFKWKWTPGSPSAFAFMNSPGSLIEKNAGEASSALGAFWPRLTQEGIAAETSRRNMETS